MCIGKLLHQLICKHGLQITTYGKLNQGDLLIKYQLQQPILDAWSAVYNSLSLEFTQNRCAFRHS